MRTSLQNERRSRACFLLLASRLVPFALCLVPLALCLALGGCERAEQPVEPTRPEVVADDAELNVLLVSVDTTRADYLGCYGHPSIQTPNIDRLAGEGTRFAQCISATPSTLPSHASILTGSYPFVHGARENSTFRLGDENETLAEILKRAGYATHAEVASIVLDAKYGLSQGFDTYGAVVAGPMPPPIPTGQDPADTDRRPQPRAHVERQADDITRQGIEWLKQNKDRQFFAFLHYYDPHLSYEPPERFSQQYADGYLAEIAFFDEQFGKVLEALDEFGLTHKTLVVMLSDHGEGRGQHGERTHCFFLYDSTLHVPLIMRLPGRIPAGQVVESQVRLVDVVPTILDFAGLEGGPQIQGTSLRPLVMDPSQDLQLAAYSDSLSGQLIFDYSALRSLRADGWKYILNPKPELYHVAEDALELYNVADAEAGRASAMRDRLREVIAQSPAPPASRGTRQVVEETDLRKLAALGYLTHAPTDVDGPLATKTELEDFEPRGRNPRDNVHAIELMCAAKGTLVTGDFENAEKCYRQLIEMEPDNSRVTKELADTLLCLKRLDEAKDMYVRALDLNPNDQAAHTAVGHLHAQEGDYAEAEKSYLEAIRLNPDNGVVQSRYANLLAELQRYDEALDHYTKAAELEPDLRDLFFKWAMALLRSGQAEESIAKFEKALEVEPGRAEIRSALVRALRAAGRPDDAFEQINQIVERDPENPLGHRNLGEWSLEKGEFAEAVKHLARAAELDMENPGVWMRLGTAESRAGMEEHAADHFRKALELQPDLPQALLGLGGVLEATDRLDEAKATYERLIEVAPDEIAAHLALIRVLASRGETAACVERLRAAHEQFPDNIVVVNDLAWRLATCPQAELRDGIEAVKLAEQAAKATEQQSPAVLDTLAAAYAEAGQFEQAVTTAEKAIELAKEHQQEDLASRIEARRAMYAKQKAYRDR